MHDVRYFFSHGKNFPSVEYVQINVQRTEEEKKNRRRDKAQLMRDTSDNKKKLIRELNTLRCHSL